MQLPLIYIIPEHFHHPKKELISINSHFASAPPSSPWQPQIYILCLWIWLFWIFHIIWTVQYVTICDRQSSVTLNNISKLTHCTMYQYFISFNGYIIYILFIYSSTSGHLLFPHFLAIINNATKSIQVHVYMWIYVFHSIGWIPGNGIAGSYNNSV